MIRLQIDTRRRVNLSKFLPKGNIHSVLAHKEGNKVILELMAEIPANESWVHENPKILNSIHKGIKSVKEGKVRRMTFDELERFVEDGKQE